MKIVPEDYGYTIGRMEHGEHNQITDVPGVKVGHYTVDEGENHTGVTVILPVEGSVYVKKPVAATYVLNGYGKTAGTVQIDELGVLESPIALTNTLNVGKVLDALTEYTITTEAMASRPVYSFNGVVGETNDCLINRITNRPIGFDEVMEAIACADVTFEEGAVGAGRGTVCMGLKGGIGSSSRIIPFGKEKFTIGALVQSNFGSTENLILAGNHIGERIAKQLENPAESDKGSIMIVVGTDLPLTERQLKRVLKRAAAGLVRTGSYMGHGSGDIFLGFTTGNCLPDKYIERFQEFRVFPENRMDKVFVATAEAVEEAIICSLLNAEACTGIKGETYHALREFLVKPE